jgi:uncharacterized protein (DUF1786 family)
MARESRPRPVGRGARRSHSAPVTNLVITDRTRVVLSWATLLAIAGLIAGAVEIRMTVADHGRRLLVTEAATASLATKDDVRRVEERIMRIETLLLSRQPDARR